VPKLSTNFEEILSLTHENFEEQNKDLGTSTIITIIIIINAYCNYIFFLLFCMCVKLGRSY